MKFVSLFAGIGGIDLGLERAGHTCVGQVEIDDYATRVLAKHWPNTPRLRDVRDFQGHEFGEFDLLTGGYPCQPFSYAGARGGENDPRHL
jgi:DNA (cytosine-5)-methyltransferase 1